MGPKRASNCKSGPSSVDGKWLPCVTLTEIQGGKVAKSKKKEKTRNFRQLTQRRKRMVEEFMAAFQANRGKYGRYGSMTWIRALIKHMNEKRYGLLPMDVQNWLATEPYFKKFNRSFLYDADTTSSSSSSFSSIKGSNAETITATERTLTANSDEARSTTNAAERTLTANSDEARSTANAAERTLTANSDEARSPTNAAERTLIVNSDEARSTNAAGSSGQSEPTSFLGIFSRSQEPLGGEPNDSSLNLPASQ